MEEKYDVDENFEDYSKIEKIKIQDEYSKKKYDECKEIAIDENGNKIEITYLDKNYIPTSKNDFVYKSIKKL